jgi:hypothetical protein
MYIGIDFSIKSPAITIRDHSGVHFYSLPRTDVVREDCEIALKEAGVDIHKLWVEGKLPSNATIAMRERSSLVDSVYETNEIIDIITTATENVIGSNVYVAIEGFSFGSSGNRLAQLSGYQWLLRYRLLEDCHIPFQNIYIFSPMTVKATAGKGNLKKEGMIDAFLADDDEDLQENGLWVEMKDNPLNFQNKKGAWLKPIDDIIDSYWVLRTLEKTVEPLTHSGI